MASLIYNRFKANLMNKVVDLEDDTIKVALMKTGHSASTVDNNVWSDVSANELDNGNGYTTGGATLTGKTVTQGTGSVPCSWDATDVTWPNSTYSAYYAVIYDSTASDNLILSIDFNDPNGVEVLDGTFTIRWNITGILTLM